MAVSIYYANYHHTAEVYLPHIVLKISAHLQHQFKWYTFSFHYYYQPTQIRCNDFLHIAALDLILISSYNLWHVTADASKYETICIVIFKELLQVEGYLFALFAMFPSKIGFQTIRHTERLVSDTKIFNVFLEHFLKNVKYYKNRCLWKEFQTTQMWIN